MRSRNRRALRDVTPGNTPQSKRTSRATAKLKEQILGATTRIPALDLEDVEEDDAELPKVPVLPTLRSPVALPVASARAPPESTPLGQSTRVMRNQAGPSHKPRLSPLPPSSPPSMSSYDEDAENRPPLVQGEEDDLQDVENDIEVVAPPEELPHTQPKLPSSDDPFGFTALERRLKLQREIRRRSAGVPAPMHVPKGKGKEIMHRRAPLGELSVVPAASTSAERAPTPYHPSDDLEDMYLDVSQAHGQERSDDLGSEGPSDGELAPPVREPTPSEEDDDPTRTPHPQHVANIIPIASPFSSREATPCDRSLPESPLSSPSPVKPLTVSRPFPVLHSSTAKKRDKGRIALLKAFPSSTPIPTPLPAAKKTRASPLSTRRVPSVPARKKPGGGDGGRMEERVEDPIAVARNLEKLLPKRTNRQRMRAQSAFSESSPIKGRGRPRKPIHRESEAGSSTERGSSADEHSLPTSPLARGKRKTPARRQYPAKRMKVEVVITRRPPLPRRAKPGSSTTRAKPASKPKSKPKSKPAGTGKGKERAGTQKLEDEDSVRASRLSF